MMGFGLLGLLLMFFFWIGLIALAVWAVKALFPSGKTSQGDPSSPGPSARQILDQRYARGEIDREQYELMKRDLGGSPG